MAGIVQPDGTTCYSGATCRRHSAYNQQMLKTWKVYFDYKQKVSDQNWMYFPYINNPDNIPNMVKKRIEEWAVRNDTTYEWAEKMAISDKEGWKVVVHPEIRRQSWQEAALFEYLNKFKGTYFNEVELLPKSPTKTTDSLTLKDGILLKNQKKVIGSDGTQLKTLDGYVTLATLDTKVYIITKYTEGKGGSQDNQANEALRSLKEQRENSGFVVAALVDGDYYQRKENNGKTWIENRRKGLPSNAFLGSHIDFLKSISAGELF